MKHAVRFAQRFVAIAALCAIWLSGHMPAAQVAWAETEANAVVQPPCNEAAFDTALASVQTSGGGTLTFNCAGAATIIFTTAKTILSNVTIDGAGQIVLSGGNAKQLFGVDTGDALTLRRITLTNGYSAGDGGAISNYGTLIVEDSTIRDSVAVASGGAIVSYGPVTVTNSTLSGNRAANAGAIYPRFPAANTVIINSKLHTNRTTSETDGWGGAILPWDGADVTIQGGEITTNTARLGGGIHNRFANSNISLTNVWMSGNTVGIYGGGIYNRDGPVSIFSSTLIGNRALDGGGIYNDYGTVALNNVTFAANTATSVVQLSGNGGGILNRGGLVGANNTTFYANFASHQGGGVFNDGGTMTLNYTTISYNSATTAGGSLYQSSAQPITLKNTVLHASQAGSNCARNFAAGLVAPASAGFNLSDDNSCEVYFNQTGDRNRTDPKLEVIADNGGPAKTLTQLPLQGSPLVDGGICIPTITTDQRGVLRPQGAACDIGAVEVRPQDYGTKVYAPIAVQ
jgi:hypothetical protein